MTTDQHINQRTRNHIYLKNSELDFFLQAFALNYMTYGGASQGEVFSAAGQIDEKRPESWIGVWQRLAEQVEHAGDASCDADHRVSARDAYLRAFTYYRMGLLAVRVRTREFVALWEKMRSVFRKAAGLFNPPFEALSIPFEGKPMPAYWMRPANDRVRRPTLILLGGGDTYAEDLYFWGGAAGLARGYNVLGIDLPGQGATPLDGLFYQPDTEAPMKVVLDTLLQREAVDPQQVVLYGLSLGGYLATRTVAYEKRIRACAAATPLVDLKQWILDAMPAALRITPGLWAGAISASLARFFNPYELIGFEKFFEWQMGCASLKDALEKFEQMKVPVEQIACPMLCMVSEGEGKTFHTQTDRCYQALKSPKKRVQFTEAEGAAAHTQAGNVRFAHQVVFDWFDEVLGR